jgi:hypothetical protein
MAVAICHSQRVWFIPRIGEKRECRMKKIIISKGVVVWKKLFFYGQWNYKHLKWIKNEFNGKKLFFNKIYK